MKILPKLFRRQRTQLCTMSQPIPIPDGAQEVARQLEQLVALRKENAELKAQLNGSAPHVS